jgi:hypothetical protein
VVRQQRLCHDIVVGHAVRVQPSAFRVRGDLDGGAVDHVTLFEVTI